MTKRPTIYDVARVAGVSHQTVSRVIKQHHVAPETREHVEQAIQQLGYRRNLAAQSLATRRSRRIGALANEMLETGPSRILQGASNAAREAGYLLDIVSLDPGRPESAQEAIDLLGQQDLAGVLAIAPTEATRALLVDAVAGVPCHVTGEADDERDGRIQDGMGTRIAIEHLAGLGHRRIALLTGPPEWMTARNAVHAYRTTMRALGAAPLRIATGDWSAASGHAAADRLPWDDGFTAVVVGNDTMALGLIAALAGRGLRVPEDVSVVGFDDVPEAAYFRPPLTTVRVDFERRGRAALHAVLRLIEGNGSPEDVDRDIPRLVLRDSTGPVPLRTTAERKDA